MYKPIFLTGIFYLALMAAFSVGCTHEPLFDDDLTPSVDTIPGPIDTTVITGTPCDPNVVYFDLQIMPILLSNCAFSGCHDVATAQKGVVLESYESVMATADVEAFDLQGSKLFKMLTEDDEDDRMPPLPAARLPQDQIQLISKWILQGAQDLDCDPDYIGCDTASVTFSQTIKPLLDTHCVGCHSGPAPSGNHDFSTYTGVENVASNGRLVGAVSWATGYTAMPFNGAKLSDCNIDKIKAWVNGGALNN